MVKKVTKRRTSTADKVKSELAIQIEFFDWMEANTIFIPELELAFSIPNELNVGSKYAGYWLNRSGRKKGVPDTLLPVARRGFHGLFIEFKRAGGKPRESQINWLDLLEKQGYFATSIDNIDEAIETIQWYFERQT